MEIREKIALYKKLLSDPNLTETQREVIAKLLDEEKAKSAPVKNQSTVVKITPARLIQRQIN